MEKLFFYLTNLTSNIAYLIIFGILLACGLGFPLPEDIPLVATGYLIWDGTIELVPAVIITLTGVLIGDSMLYFFGHKLGLRILEPVGNRRPLFKPERVRRVRAYFRKYGGKIVFFARFVAGLRAVAFFMAGAMNLRFSRFLLLDTLAAIISVPLWILLGYGLGYYWGDSISEVLRTVKDFKHILNGVVLVVLAVVIVRFLLRYRQTRLEKPARKGRANQDVVTL